MLSLQLDEFVTNVVKIEPLDGDPLRAREIVAAFDATEVAGVATVLVGGSMVDYPVVEKARRVLATSRDH